MLLTLDIAGFAIEADWVEACATVAAAFGTIGAFFWQARALAEERETRRDEIERLEADQHDTQAAQAAAVVLHSPAIGGADGLGILKFNVTVENFGSAPIINAKIHLQLLGWPTEKVSEWHLLTVLPGGNSERVSWDLRKFNLEWPEDLDPDEAAKELFLPVAYFIDVHGVTWERPFFGHVKRFTVVGHGRVRRERSRFHLFRRPGQWRRGPRAAKAPRRS
ncbi:hypothetical protein [Micromonospora sp. NPDC049204]|uniref:hypothetical protein n=1 Tax=Micromonospora sp. NPDC049204 TaxID=3154351 RepID=UPI00340537EE